MEYAKHYNNLMIRAKQRKLTGYKERHHVLPKCLGGGNEKDNIVELTAEEHFVAHKLLVMMHPGNSKLLYSAVSMTKGNNKQAGRSCNKLYGWLKREWQLRDPWNKGKKASGEARRKMSEARRGKKFGPRSEETKRKMSEASKGRKKSSEHCATLSRVRTGKKLKPHSDETKRKIAESNRRVKQGITPAYMLTPEYKQALSEQMKRVWAERKQLSNILK
jgi:hypothetical protein